jgi:hypothetical protein
MRVTRTGVVAVDVALLAPAALVPGWWPATACLLASLLVFMTVTYFALARPAPRTRRTGRTVADPKADRQRPPAHPQWTDSDSIYRPTNPARTTVSH